MVSQSELTSVIGLQFGDEGKGQLVDWLAQSHDVTVRYNGGANAGHAITVNNQRFVLHQVPVGCLTPGKVGVLANGVALHVPSLLEELSTLEDAGVVDVDLKVSRAAHLVMPYHLVEDSLRHTLAVRMGHESLGTTGKGIGPCYADKASRDTGLRVADLLQPKILARRLELTLAIKNATLSSLAGFANVAYEPFHLGPVLEECTKWATVLRPFVADTGEFLVTQERAGRAILFEGANASGLDLDFGGYPFVTSSNGSNLGMTSGSGFLPEGAVNRLGVVKTYLSRAGTGPLPTELFGAQAEEVRQTGREFGSTTNRPRRVGWLDLPALRHGVQSNRISGLVLTGLFVLAQLKEFQVCVGYDGDTPQLERFVVDGPLPVAMGTSGSEMLPDWCVRLINLMELHLAPVAGICLGPKREQLVWR
jgi:adenylosuccinate synthase